MSPVAVELLPTTLQLQNQPMVGAPGPALVIGSPSTAQDGTYPSLINELERDTANVSEVEKQMVDRILDGGGLIHSCLFPLLRRGRMETDRNLSFKQLLL